MFSMIHVLLVAVTCFIPEILGNKTVFNVFQFQQNDYNLTLERAEVVHYDLRYVKYAKITTFKYNRTCPALNATFNFNVRFGYDWLIVVQAYKFLSNEYRLFPIRFQIKFCDALSTNALGLATVRNCGNFSGCPIRKGVLYHTCNWTIDQSKFPPLIPDGRYMFDLLGFYNGGETGLVRLYMSVSRPFQ